MMYYGHYYGGLLWMIVFWAAVIWFIVWLVRKESCHVAEHKSESPLEVLKLRYAKGEITKKQFDEMKNEIM